MYRNPWEIDWSDPQQADPATNPQRPLIQRPREASPPTPQNPEQRASTVTSTRRTEQQIQQSDTGGVNFQDENGLAQRFRGEPVVRTYEQTLPTYFTLMHNTPDTRAGDLSLVYGTANILDPGAVVRESDSSLVQNTAAIDERIAGAIRTLNGGGQLTADTRAQLREMLESRMGSVARNYNRLREDYARNARRYNFDPNAIVGTHPALPFRQQLDSRTAPPSLAGEQQEPQGPSPAAAPGEIPTQFNRPAMPRGPGQRELNAETDIRTNPALAGLNAHVGEMLRRRRPMGEIISYIRERGQRSNVSFPMQAIVSDIRALQRWRAQNPQYRGPFNVQLENYEVQLDPVTSTLASAADSAFGAAAGNYVNDITGQHLDNIVNAAGGDGQLVNDALGELERRHPYASAAGHIGAGASLYGAGRAAAGRILGGALPTAVRTFSPGAIAGDAALGGYIGSGSEGDRVFSLTGAARGAAGAAAGGIAGRGFINSVGGAVSPTGGELAPLYREGVEPSIGQRMGGVVNRVEQGLASIPIIGGIQRRSRDLAVQQMQRGAFNQALRDIGQTLPDNVSIGIPAHRYMQNAFNREFRDIRGQMRFSPDNQWGQDLGAIQQDVSMIAPQSQQTFNQIVASQIGSRLRARGGTLTGRDYIQLTSRLDAKVRAIRNNPNGDRELADALESLSNAVDAAAARQSAPELAQRLSNARRGYQKAVIIEDAARRRGGDAGTFSPAHLNAGVQSVAGGLRSRQFLAGNAPMQDYAQASLRLGQTLADSGTPERLMTMGTGAAAVGATGGGSLLASPLFAAPWALNTAMNLPGIRKGVSALLAPNRTALSGMRQQIEDRSYLGPIFGYPAGSAAAAYLAGQ